MCKTEINEGLTMERKNFIFLAGLHRSGTSLLHEIIRGNSSITGFSGTGVPEDEGQHLQSVYPTAKSFGGPGKFAFNSESYMDESHPLANSENSTLLFNEWSKHLDLSCDYIIEKSPPNIIRTRFFQKLFPNSKFVVILRHPLAVSYATQKWAKTSISTLLEHTFLAYESLFKDLEHINSAYILRYEDFVLNPQTTIDGIFGFLDLESVQITHNIRQDVNEKYFAMWEKDKKNILNRLLKNIPKNLELVANKYGYSINDYETLQPAPWLGEYPKNSID